MRQCGLAGKVTHRERHHFPAMPDMREPKLQLHRTPSENIRRRRHRRKKVQALPNTVFYRLPWETGLLRRLSFRGKKQADGRAEQEAERIGRARGDFFLKTYDAKIIPLERDRKKPGPAISPRAFEGPRRAVVRRGPFRTLPALFRGPAPARKRRHVTRRAQEKSRLHLRRGTRMGQVPRRAV